MSRLEELTEDFGATLKHMAEQSYKPMTNGDKIRAMSDEELAEFLCGVYDEEETDKFICGTIIPNYYEEAICDWLKQPAEGK